MKKILFATAITILFALSSCHKFKGQSVPAYIYIDTCYLISNYYTTGANTHAISDVWVYVDDQTLGCFELPATVPILKNGKHKLSLRAGIKVNGISATRAWYPFFKTLDYVDFELIEDSIQRIRPTFEYYDANTVHVAWMEDFENAALSIVPTTQSDTNIVRTNVNDEAYKSNYSSWSGKVVMPGGQSTSCILASYSEFTNLPKTGAACMLEMDYKSSFDSLAVGVIYSLNNTITQWPLINLAATDLENAMPKNVWRKMYINIGPIVAANPSAEYFKIYIGYTNNSDKTQYFFLDNLKLLYRDTYSY